MFDEGDHIVPESAVFACCCNAYGEHREVADLDRPKLGQLLQWPTRTWAIAECLESKIQGLGHDQSQTCPRAPSPGTAAACACTARVGASKWFECTYAPHGLPFW